MILLTITEIITIHSKLIKQSGGLDGIRDIGLLESAVANANNSFYGVEQYSTIEEKASRLAFAIVSNHAFIDGNKRIGILVMLMTLKLNNIHINYSQEELVDLGLKIASRVYNYEDIYEWVTFHKI